MEHIPKKTETQQHQQHSTVTELIERSRKEGEKKAMLGSRPVSEVPPGPSFRRHEPSGHQSRASFTDTGLVHRHWPQAKPYSRYGDEAERYSRQAQPVWQRKRVSDSYSQRSRVSDPPRHSERGRQAVPYSVGSYSVGYSTPRPAEISDLLAKGQQFYHELVLAGQSNLSADPPRFLYELYKVSDELLLSMSSRSSKFCPGEVVELLGNYVYIALQYKKFETASKISRGLYEHYAQHYAQLSAAQRLMPEAPETKIMIMVLENIARCYCRKPEAVNPQDSAFIHTVLSFAGTDQTQCLDRLGLKEKQQFLAASYYWCSTKEQQTDTVRKLLDKLPYRVVAWPASDNARDFASALEARMHWLFLSVASFYEDPQQCKDKMIAIGEEVKQGTFDPETQMRLVRTFIQLRVKCLQMIKAPNVEASIEACKEDAKELLLLFDHYRQAGEPFLDQGFQNFLDHQRFMTLIECGYLYVKEGDFDRAGRCVDEIKRKKRDGGRSMNNLSVLEAHITRVKAERNQAAGGEMSPATMESLQTHLSKLEGIARVYGKANREIDRIEALLSQSCQRAVERVSELIEEENYEMAMGLIEQAISAGDESYQFIPQRSTIYRKFGEATSNFDEKCKYYKLALDWALDAYSEPRVAKSTAWLCLKKVALNLEDAINEGKGKSSRPAHFPDLDQYRGRLPKDVRHVSRWGDIVGPAHNIIGKILGAKNR